MSLTGCCHEMDAKLEGKYPPAQAGMPSRQLTMRGYAARRGFGTRTVGVRACVPENISTRPRKPGWRPFAAASIVAIVVIEACEVAALSEGGGAEAAPLRLGSVLDR